MTNRKKIILTAIATLFIGCAAFSQNCSNMAIKDGSKITVNITTFTNPERKEDKISAFNADVASGKIKPASNYNMEFNIKKTKLKNGDEYAIGYTVSGVNYFSYVVCSNDTLYIARNRGPIQIGTKENPIGYSIQGIQTLPMNLKVGDQLPSFEDISFLFPTTADVTLKKSVFDGYINQHSDYWGYGTDSKTGETGTGWFDKTTPRAVFKEIDVKARQTVSVSGHSIQGVNAIITGEEEVTISGVKYKAYIMESESWSKANIKTSYESSDKELNQAQAEADKKMDKKIEKFNSKRMFTNKQGYSVMYSKGWYVPALGGSVKSISYDMFGGISTVITTTGLE